MTREEYLSALKVEIMSLTTEEQQEALQYYSDYFDAANDDEKIINELGEPKELAKEIIEKFANVPVRTSSIATHNQYNLALYELVDYVQNVEKKILCFLNLSLQE